VTGQVFCGPSYLERTIASGGTEPFPLRPRGIVRDAVEHQIAFFVTFLAFRERIAPPYSSLLFIFPDRFEVALPCPSAVQPGNASIFQVAPCVVGSLFDLRILLKPSQGLHAPSSPSKGFFEPSVTRSPGILRSAKLQGWRQPFCVPWFFFFFSIYPSFSANINTPPRLSILG